MTRGISMRVSADVGGTFTDLVVEFDRRRVPPVQGTDHAGGSCRRHSRCGRSRGRRSGEDTGAIPRRRRHVHPCDDALDQCDPDQQHGAYGDADDGGPSRHPGLSRGRPERAVQLYCSVSRSAACRAASPSRSRSASATAARSSRRSTRPPSRPSSSASRSSTWRPSASACSGRSSIRRTSSASAS